VFSFSQIQTAKHTKTNAIRSTKPNPQASIRSNLGSCPEVFIAYSKKQTTKSHMYLRDTARPKEGAGRENILWYSLFVTRGFIYEYLNVCANNLIYYMGISWRM